MLAGQEKQKFLTKTSKQLRWDQKIGVIKKGFLADIVAVGYDLDKNIRAIMNVQFVMKDGKIYVNKLHAF